MVERPLVSVLAILAAFALSDAPAHAQSRNGDPNSIMTPEPWLGPRYQSPRGLPQRIKPARPSKPSGQGIQPRIAQPAPPTIVPGLKPVPNLAPLPRGFVPGGGTETFQDRATRCTHQMGVFGVPSTHSSVYMHSCAMN
jgi:hypothetical protein